MPNVMSEEPNSFELDRAFRRAAVIIILGHALTTAALLLLFGCILSAL